MIGQPIGLSFYGSTEVTTVDIKRRDESAWIELAFAQEPYGAKEPAEMKITLFLQDAKHLEAFIGSLREAVRQGVSAFRAEEYQKLEDAEEDLRRKRDRMKPDEKPLSLMERCGSLLWARRCVDEDAEPKFADHCGHVTDRGDVFLGTFDTPNRGCADLFMYEEMGELQGCLRFSSVASDYTCLFNVRTVDSWSPEHVKGLEKHYGPDMIKAIRDFVKIYHAHTVEGKRS